MIECMNPLYLTHRLNDSKGNVGMTLSFFLTILVSLGGELMKYFRLVHQCRDTISYYQMKSVNPPSFPVDFSQCNSCVINL